MVQTAVTNFIIKFTSDLLGLDTLFSRFSFIFNFAGIGSRSETSVHT
jgi:hypothetical protein